MNNIWNKWLKDTLLIYCGLYTFATILNSIAYLANGIYEDPSGNWHELDRAVIVLIAVLAYVLTRHIKISNFFMKALVVYAPTMLLVFLYVYLCGTREELASSAYRDIFINYTLGFVIVALIAFVKGKVWKKKAKSE